jgi:putative transcriptional regulator
MSSTASLSNQFLIAMPAMADPFFAKSLVFVCEHTEHGALGIIVNRPLDMTLAKLFEKVDLPLEQAEFQHRPVYFGGPVQTDRGFVLHRPLGGFQSTLRIHDELGLTSSRDVLQKISSDGDPNDILVTLGYAGWSAGQLENEIAQNAWLTAPADEAIMFDLPPESRMPAAMQGLGISFTHLADTAGHA